MTRTSTFHSLVALAALTISAPFVLETRGESDAQLPAVDPAVAAPATLPAAATARAGAAPATQPATPTITFRDPPTDDQRAVVEWAIARYAEAGLRLPDLEFSFPFTCGGKGGRYFVGQNRIEVCQLHRKVVLHELAHAWDDNTALDRTAFLRERGLEHWYEQPCERSYESGGEQLAMIVTWGLMDVDLTHPVAEWTGQPLDEQPHLLPGLADGTPEVLTELFVELTGTTPLIAPDRQVELDQHRVLHRSIS